MSKFKIFEKVQTSPMRNVFPVPAGRFASSERKRERKRQIFILKERVYDGTCMLSFYLFTVHYYTV